jgi:hypothetical protein
MPRLGGFHKLVSPPPSLLRRGDIGGGGKGDSRSVANEVAYEDPFGVNAEETGSVPARVIDGLNRHHSNCVRAYPVELREISHIVARMLNSTVTRR